MKRRLAIQLPFVLAARGVCNFASEVPNPTLPLSIATLKMHPRIRTSIELYLDAVAGYVSAHTRYRNTADCIYLCCCESAELKGIRVTDIEHPSTLLVESQTSCMGVTGPDAAAIQALVAWAASWTPLLPSVPLAATFILARRIIAETIISFPESSHLWGS
jgi:hypothetical protein